TYSQRDFKGATLSPLIVAVHSSIIVRGDVVPSGGQTVQVVASDVNVDPDTLLDLERGVSIPVQTRYLDTATLATVGHPTTEYCLGPVSGFALAVVPDPFPTTPLAFVQAARSAGSTAQLLNDSGLVWRGRDTQGPKVYVVDTPGGSACSNYAIAYELATETPSPTPSATPTSTPTATSTSTPNGD